MKKLYPMRVRTFGPKDPWLSFDDDKKRQKEARHKKQKMAFEGGLALCDKIPDTVHDCRSIDSPLMAAIQTLSSKVEAISNRSASSPLQIHDAPHAPPAGGAEVALKGGSVGAFVDDLSLIHILTLPTKRIV